MPEYLQIITTIVATLLVLILISSIGKRKTKVKEHFLTLSDKLKIIERAANNENKGFKINVDTTGKKIKKSDEHNEILRYFEQYQLLVEDLMNLKSADLMSLSKIETARENIHEHKKRLKSAEANFDCFVQDTHLLNLKSKLQKSTSTFYKRVLRRLKEFENIQLQMEAITGNSENDALEMELLKKERIRKYKEYSQQKLDFYEARKDVFKRMVYKIYETVHE